MKKLIFLLLPVLILCIGINAKAYSTQDKDKLKNQFYTKYGITLNDTLAGNLLTYWENNASTYPQMWVQYNSSRGYAWAFGTYDHEQSGSIYYSGIKLAWTSNPTNETSLPAAGSPGLTAIPSDSLSLGTWESFHVVPIDWDTVYYSANILPPELDITYRELSSVPIVDVPLNVDLVAEPQNVYIEIGAVFFCPDEVYAWSDNGTYSFNTVNTTGFSKTIIDKEDLVLASNASSSYIHLALNDAWEDVYNAIPMSDITWHTDPNYSTNLVNTMKSRFENIRKVCCFYGNELRLFVRYFVINNNTQFVVGSWRVWYSKTPNSYTDQTPTWYQPYIPASGTSGTSTNTGSNTQQDPDIITIPPGTGDPTGIYYNPTTNITVGSNVPNYPDYPTIRSYNADNFLVQTMNYLDYLNDPDTEHDLFGEFGSFLKTVFVFIPGEIWSIIAVGLCLTIVVMFLKIL